MILYRLHVYSTTKYSTPTTAGDTKNGHSVQRKARPAVSTPVQVLGVATHDDSVWTDCDCGRCVNWRVAIEEEKAETKKHLMSKLQGKRGATFKTTVRDSIERLREDAQKVGLSIHDYPEQVIAQL